MKRPHTEPYREPGLGHALVAGIALLTLAVLAAGAVWLALALLLSLRQYVPALP